MKILIFNPFGMGDVLFTTPLIRNLKKNFPTVSIHYLCNRRTYPLLKSNIFLDKVSVFEKDEWKDLARASRFEAFKKGFSFFREIKNERFDIVFDLSLKPHYGFFLKMAGIKMRIGHNFKNRAIFLTHKIDISEGYKDKHVARYHLSLLKFLNIQPKDYRFDLFISPQLISRAKSILQRFNLKEDAPLVGVCPGSGDSWGDTAHFRRWPKEYFLEVCKGLQNDFKAKVILFGSKAEVSLCDFIDQGLNGGSLNLCGKVDLEEFVALFSLCNLIIVNDGGPFHIAQALGKKIIVFFGPVDERVYGAYPDTDNCIAFKKDLNCRPCYQQFRFPECPFDKKCLRDIGVDETLSAIKKLIASH